LTPHQEDYRFRLLRILASQPQVSQRRIAEDLGLSLGAVNYLLRALIEKGVIKIQNFRSSEKKTSYAYLLTPIGMTEKARLTKSFLTRKRAEYQALKLEIESINKETEALGHIDSARILYNSASREDQGAGS